ncbi:hypothetical protein A2316_01995 [Candidatus Falkowbacteria bacterium RIFOXYB2_FULL_38_15]|uniref:Uncharacterized protein n=1 Tax=Candidatus Falkowbacteria bacterium RIFOXYA2_FULL_38_12 TaxID=1797993 RepID=A0A1F5S3N3_9BACT|nr:MAG: hypothetical protein A2257_00800 [Candidatus Falkowbacteria bacterium RIFOXYA2_FULL_38_12]OGF33267.1 MAG: hypothetical protein A2316_01995 [Candidatus Falkowbacteria bacterium RIFOXYB2_FULL_38_15]OGF42358.1 MAG: hypothetical protein A2555_00200 [Candidatus Falkowbacteria bacterium RIFOXYD2_FULL_39_16]
MKKIILIIIVVLLLGFFVPKIFIKDSYSLSQDDRDSITMLAYDQFNNFMEKLLIIEITIDDKKDETVYASAYTFGGLKYATLELNFRHEGKITWRRWSGK